MKISKSLLQSIAVAVAITTTLNACVKDSVSTNDEKNCKQIKKDSKHDCPGCGMG